MNVFMRLLSNLQCSLRRSARRAARGKTARLAKDESGVALMLALFAVTMLMIIATELMYETNVELVVSSQAINQVRAHYAAQSGVEISLLRIHIYKKAVAAVGSAIPASMLDPIWQFPFAWPPPVTQEMTLADQDEIRSAVKASTMQGQYVATIESEGSKIDVNDLASASKVVADATKLQIQQVFESKIESDEDFAERYRGFDFNILINNMIDWVDSDKESLNGGDESSIYARREEVEDATFLPPNQAFKTLQELHLVEGMTDELYEILAPRLTLYGSKGINVNYAKKDVLMSLTPQITSEIADEILKAIQDPQRGPFKDEADFVQFLASQGIAENPFRSGDELKVPLVFATERNFRIRSLGRSGKVNREITAIVYDYSEAKARLGELASAQLPRTATPDPEQAAPTPTPTASPASGNQQQSSPNERPIIVYWNET